MQTRKIKKILWNSFWLSLLIHLVVLIYLYYMMVEPVAPVKKILPVQNEYVPAYTYTGSIQPGHQQQKAAKKQPQTAAKAAPMELPATAQAGDIYIPKKPAKRHAPSSASFLADAFNIMREEQIQDMSQQGEPDPIYLVGDDSQPSDPLIRLIGRSLSKHFKYPPTAGRLGIRGRVIVKLTLHPEGYYSDVQILQSSHSADLDNAALYAVNAAPQVNGADRFISKPKRMVIGFIFN